MRADQAIVYIKNEYLKFDLVGRCKCTLIVLRTCTQEDYTCKCIDVTYFSNDCEKPGARRVFCLQKWRIFVTTVQYKPTATILCSKCLYGF